MMKGVEIERPRALVAWVNGATEDQLSDAGVSGGPLNILLESRPFDTAKSIGKTRGIGKKTLEALRDAVPE